MKNIILKKTSKHTQELKTAKMHTPAVFFTAHNVNTEIARQVEKAAANTNITGKMAVLSDAHVKKNVLNVEGAIIASEKYILPHMLDTAVNCGMRIITTDLKESEINRENIRALFSTLQRDIPTYKFIGETIPFDLAKKIVTNGSQALEKYFHFRIKNEITNTYADGNFFISPLLSDYALADKDIFQVIPEIFVRLSRYRYGILGATSSHSICLARLVSVTDMKDRKKVLDIHDGQYVFTMHSGSGIIGRYISYLYSPQEQTLQHKIPVQIGKILFDRKAKARYNNVRKALATYSSYPDEFGLPENSEEGKSCLQAFCAAGNIGFANRAVLSHKVDRILEKHFGRAVDLDLLSDAPHVFIDKERHGKREMTIHRNGAVRARKNEPVYVAPFMNTPGYLGIGTGEDNGTFHSANHEIGKIEDVDPLFLQHLAGTGRKLEPVMVFAQDGIITITPEAKHALYAETVAAEMQKNRIMRIVARIQPVAVLTF